MSLERSQRGFGATIAVALLVMIAVLGSAVVMLSASQQSGFALDVQGGRAYQAARSALEWGMHHVLRAGGTDCAALTAPGSTFSYAGDLSGFHATVACSETSHKEGASAAAMYQVTATACNQLAAGRCDPTATPTTPNYVERQLRVVVGAN